MVAVKIIEHSADINSKIEGFRETMVSSNIQHPNVVSSLSHQGASSSAQPTFIALPSQKYITQLVWKPC